ncbi:MAG: fibronectin type III domain-containing protein, partial [Candidatus Helarchaeota archaeon]|nr:fibronectin type III domain-containing protein [Candidatus Helarchaeota archaeon]
DNYYNDTGLVDGKTYLYKISAYDDGWPAINYGVNSTPFSETPQDTEPPAQVMGVAILVDPVGNKLDISWNALGGDVLGYWIYQNDSLIANIIHPQNWYNDTGLLDDYTYVYKISAYDEVFNPGPNSTSTSEMPQDSTPPSQVTDLTISNPTTGKTLVLSWTANTEPDLNGYRIYRRNLTSSYKLLMTVGITSTYQDTNVTDSVTYYYKVAAIDEVPNEGLNSTEWGGISTNVLPPAKVTGLIVTSSSNTSLLLNWTANTEPDLKYYNIYRSTLRGFSPGPGNKVNTTTTPYYNDTGLTYLQKYYYRVSAEDIAGLEGPYSSQKSGVPGGALLDKPVNINVTVITTGETLYLTWDNVSGAATYNIYRDTVEGFTPTVIKIIKTVSSNETYDSAGLIDNTTYYYRITGVSSDDVEGHISDEVNGTPIDTVEPPPVANLIVSNPGIGNTLQLTWDTSPAPDLDYYLVYRNSTTESWALIATDIKTNSYTDLGLNDSTTYFYMVAAVDDGGPTLNVGDNSTIQNGTPTDITAPPQITGVMITVIPEGNILNITWGASMADDFVEYYLYRNSTTQTWAPLVNRTVNYYLDTGLTNLETYWYMISAVDEVPNEGTYSTPKSEIPMDLVAPPAVLGLAVAVIPTGNTLNLTWNPSTAPDLDHYNVYMSNVTPFTPGPPYLVYSGNDTFYLNTMLEDGTTYYFKVSAVDDDNIEGPIVTQISETPADIAAPTQVTGVIVTVVPEGNALNLQWDNLSVSIPDVMGYKIYRSTVPGFEVIPGDEDAITPNLFFNDTGLTDNGTYYYRIIAFDDGWPTINDGTPSDEVNGTPQDTVKPPQVGNLNVVNPGIGNTLQLTWDALGGDVVEYRIYRNSTSEPWALIATRPINSYTNTELNDSTTYFYMVAAVDDGGPTLNVGDNSTIQNGTPTDITAPPQITGVMITVIPEGNILNITWGASMADDFVEYYLYRNSTTQTWAPLVNRTVNYYLDTGLTNLETYWYMISAVDEVPNEGTYSTPKSEIPMDLVAPPAVLGLAVAVIPTGNTLNLTWNPSTAPDLDHYNVYMSNVTPFTPGPPYLVYSGNDTFYLNTMLEDGTTYYFKVSAVDDDNIEGPIVTQISETPADIAAPTQVTGVIVTVVPEGNALNLQWDNLSVSIPDVMGYKIYRSTVPGFEVIPGDEDAITPNLFFNDTGLTDNGTYYYRIIAFDDGWPTINDGTPSDEVNGTPQDTVKPPQVGNLNVVNPGIGNTLQLTWDALGGDVVEYRIYRNSTSEPWALIATRPTNSYTNTELNDGTLYFYKVAAIDDGGPTKNVGDNSTIQNGTPTDIIAPPQITGVMITVIPEGNILNLTWNPSVATDFKEYYLYRNSTTETWTFITNLNVSHYQDTALTNLETYWYKVSAVDEVPNEGTDSTAKPGVPEDSIAPPAVTILTVTVIPTGNTLNITWDLVVAGDMQEYRVHRSNISSGFTPSPANFVDNVSRLTNYFLDTGLTDGLKYYYKVLSVDDDGNYLPAATQKSGTPGDTVPPLQPSSFNVTNVAGSLILNWTAAQEDDFVKYEILRNGTTLLQSIANNATNSWIDFEDQLFDSEYYFYEIRVFDEVGYDTVSPPRLTSIISPSGDITPPDNVTNLFAQSHQQGGYIRLRWSAPANPDILYFKIYRSTTPGFTPNSSNLIDTVMSVAGTNYYYDLDETLDGTGTVSYYYQVRAVDESNNTATGCNEVSFAPSDTIRPDPVITFNLLPQPDGSIDLTWTAVTPPDFYAYNIYRVVDINPYFPPSPANLIHIEYNNNTQIYVDSQENLLDDQYYTYKISVADEVGESSTEYAFNKTEGDKTPPSAPTGFAVINEGTGNIMNISWNANPELDVHHYNLYRNISVTVFSKVTEIYGRDTTVYQDKGLTEYPPTNYSYYLIAVDERGNVGPISEIKYDVTNDTRPPDMTDDSIVGGVTAESQIYLIITSPPDPDTTWYNIYRWNGSWKDWTGNLSDYGLIDNKLKISDPQLWLEPEDLPIGNYSYYVSALDEDMLPYHNSLEGSPSNFVNITISRYPPTLTQLIDITNNSDIRLNWSRHINNPPVVLAGYYIYRMNSSTNISYIIDYVPYIVGVDDYSYIEYGVPDGNWTYYVVAEDKWNGTSFPSNLMWVNVSDTVVPGSPTNLNAFYIGPPGSPDFTISWNRPTDENFGADVLSYEIYCLTTPFTNITGLTPYDYTFGQADSFNGTIVFPATNYTFGPLPDDTYYIRVVALDEKGNRSLPSDMIIVPVDTTPPDIITITYPTGDIPAGEAVYINVTVHDRGGISLVPGVYITYTVDGGPPQNVFMNFVASFWNGTHNLSIYGGEIPGQPEGSFVNFTITVEDWRGLFTTSTSFDYSVKIEEFPIYIIVVIGAVAVGAVAMVMVVARSRAKGKKKEYIAEELLPLPI